jgi:radical SAM protein with 4Fe4S-binding SPASM domain
MQPATPPVFDDVFVLPLETRQLLFSPRRKVCALLNAAAVQALGESDRSDSSDLSDLRLMLEDPPPEVACRTGPARPVFLGLITTRACNMACRYCDFAAQPDQPHMSLPMAMAAVNGWTDHLRSIGETHLELHFFGGEPFVAGDVIQAAVLRTRALAARHGMTTHFEASTNGLLSDRDLRFVRDYFNAIVLSLDGGQDEHDRHRPTIGGGSSFGRVLRTARQLADSPVDLCLRCCVSNKNVEALASIADWMCRELQPKLINFEPLSMTCEAQDAGLEPPDTLAYTRNFIAASRVAARYGVECVFAAAYDKARADCCPVGRDAFIVVPSGEVRSCYMRGSHLARSGFDLRLGTVALDHAPTIDPAAIGRLRRLATERPGCDGCFCTWSCAGGCVVREPEPRLTGKRTTYCQLTRMLQACLLLENLGQHELVDRLLAEPAALEAMAMAPDDRIQHTSNP